ncbi:NUDIX domain-containing protein [Streptomyces sp. S186]|uniref:NUDIX domain-containing protein n=1 Tax=Streptomyces sp. S186 TaxID=3434395 RepID=UPI003F669820
MAGKRSAGLLLYRGGADGGIEVLLAHMGGPLWARRDAGAWSVPKGEYLPPEEPLAAARREFAEELGMAPPEGRYLPLGDVRQSGGKVVTVWAVEADLDPDRIQPGTFEMEWPRGSGVLRTFPEIDRVAWWSPREAYDRLIAAQRAFLDRLADVLAGGGAGESR